MNQPKVSVILSFYNNNEFLELSVESILNQTFRDFEFIILDDGSTDGSAKIVMQYDDPRIVFIQNKSNLGLTASLNHGLKSAKGEYIARMDADDIAIPNRLEKQVDYLDKNNQVGLLGTQRILIDVDGKPVNKHWPLPTDDLHIRWMLLFSNPFAHPTVMFRRELILKYNLYYDESYITTQDYELWSRMLLQTKAANLSEELLYYRLGQGVKQTHRYMQIKNTIKVIQHNMKHYLKRDDISNREIENILALFFLGLELSDKVIVPKAHTIRIYIDVFCSFVDNHSRYYDSKAVKQLKYEVIYESCLHLLRPPLKIDDICYSLLLLLKHPKLIISITSKLIEYCIKKYKHYRVIVCVAF